MRIALATHGFSPSLSADSERSILELASQLTRMGHEAIVVAPSERASGEEPGYVYGGTWVRTVAAGGTDLNRPRAEDRPVVDRLVNVLREESSDIVHVMQPMRLPQAFEAATVRGLPVVAHIVDFAYLCARVDLLRPDESRCPSAENGAACVSACGIDSGVERYAWGKTLLARAAAVVSPSRWTIERYAEEGFDTTAWHHIPWGTDYANHEGRLDLAPTRDELALGFLGTLVRHQGAHVVAKALRLLPDRPIRLLLYGSFDDGDYEWELREIAGDDERIVFAGSYDHAKLPSIYAQLSAVVVPSIRYENLPPEGLDAIAAGVPLITSDLGGVKELVDDYDCGFTYAADEPEALATLLGELCNDRALLDDVRRRLVLPPRLEEEAWMLEGIYADCLAVGVP